MVSSSPFPSPPGTVDAASPTPPEPGPVTCETRRALNDPNPDPHAEPWASLDPNVREALWREGYKTPAAVAKLGGREIRVMKGFGEKGYRQIRAIWPDPSTKVGDPRLLPVGGKGGGGQLQRGNPGNRGGRDLKSHVRQAATLRFERQIPRLEAIAEGQLGVPCEACGRGEETVTVTEMLRAIDLLGKYGPGTQHDVVQALDYAKALDFVGALAGRLTARLMDRELQKVILEDWKDVIRQFFPRR